MSILEVNCDNIECNPRCAHGPTLKFARLVKGRIKRFYACAACRDRKDCPFFLWEGEDLTESKRLALEDWKKQKVPEINHEALHQRLNSYKKLKHKRQFCLGCFDFVFPNESSLHNGHSVENIVTNDMLTHPSKLLIPLCNNKKEAQFWFSEQSKQFVVDNLVHVNVQSVICLGTPTIHEVLRTKQINSLLMDIDHRYHWFYNPQEFCWFNMFNFHFMSNESLGSAALNRALNFSDIIIVVDPPFGARIEPLKKTIEKFSNLTSNKIELMLILPYFMEPQVLSSFPNFVMLDFQVEYVNHCKFQHKQNNLSKKGSPVRIFTDIPCNKFLFPKNGSYHYCELCKAWRSKLNKHCNYCNTCTSKNGDAYRHCSICKKCVKQTWIHCTRCKKCCLTGHVCANENNRLTSFKHKQKK